jgi:hypothetical protein
VLLTYLCSTHRPLGRTGSILSEGGYRTPPPEHRRAILPLEQGSRLTFEYVRAACHYEVKSSLPVSERLQDNAETRRTLTLTPRQPRTLDPPESRKRPLSQEETWIQRHLADRVLLDSHLVLPKSVGGATWLVSRLTWSTYVRFCVPPALCHVDSCPDDVQYLLCTGPSAYSSGGRRCSSRGVLWSCPYLILGLLILY